MAKYKVTIEEHITQTFEVEAENIGEASRIISERYNSGDLVLDNCELQTSLISAYDPENGDATEWKEI